MSALSSPRSRCVLCDFVVATGESLCSDCALCRVDEGPTEPIDLNLIAGIVSTPLGGVAPLYLRPPSNRRVSVAALPKGEALLFEREPSAWRSPYTDEHFRLAVELFRRGDVAMALRAADLAVRSDPLDREAHKLLEVIDDERTTAIAERKPLHRAARLRFEDAVLAAEAGRHEAAITAFEASLAISAEAVTCDRLGMLLFARRSELSRAEELLQTAVELDPAEPRYSRNLLTIASTSMSRERSRRRPSARRASSRAESRLRRQRGY